MTKTVNKNDLANAHRSKRLLDPAIEALKKIDLHTVGHDPYAIEKIASFNTYLERFVFKADKTIAQAKTQFDNRPQYIISAATSRMFQIPSHVEIEQKAIESKIAVHQTKTEEMKRQGFDESEIKKIIPFPQAEIDAHADTITSLKAEQKNIEVFLADAPRYDAALLNMEKLSSFMQHCKIAE
ncbi:MAG: hypothetical protein ACXWT3_08060 [Methylococcaceae bacterium]